MCWPNAGKEKARGDCRPGEPKENLFLTINYVSTPASAVKSSHEDTPGSRDLILSSLRVAATRSRLVTNILDSVGVALRQKQIDCAGAWRG